MKILSAIAFAMMALGSMGATAQSPAPDIDRR